LFAFLLRMTEIERSPRICSTKRGSGWCATRPGCSLTHVSVHGSSRWRAIYGATGVTRSGGIALARYC
jgi:hypothetical protein